MSDPAESYLPTPAWNSPREMAEYAVEEILGANDNRIAEVVDAAFAVLDEPDRDMMSAGLAAMELALNRSRAIDQRELIAAIWRAMIAEARK